MLNKIKIFLLIVLLGSTIQAKDYTKKSNTKVFINMMVKKYHFKKSHLNRLFKNVKFQQRVLGIFNPVYQKKPKNVKIKHYPKHGSWDRYEKRLLGATRVKKGVEYIHNHRNTFKKVYRKYGVPPEYISAIIGVESYYGYNRGKFPVFDVLTTLAFEPNRRAKYFRYELKEFLLLSKRERFNPKDVKGSYAGAIGLGQFMPSAYKPFAVDFNGDGKRSMQNAVDAIAGIANYFKKNGWKKGEPVAVRVSYRGNRFNAKKTGYIHKYSRVHLDGIVPKNGKWIYNGKVRLIKLDRYNYDELWYGAKNFFVITRYNHSSYYAMAIHQLAQKIKREYKKKYGVYPR